MPEGINIAWNMGVQITGGPRISLDGAMTVDAYDTEEILFGWLDLAPLRAT